MMKLVCLGLLGPILYLGTAPVGVAAIPAALAALLAGLEFCHRAAESVMKVSGLAKHAPPEEEAPCDAEEGSLSSADEAVRNKLLSAGILAPGAAAIAAVHGKSSTVTPVTLDEPLPLAAVAEHLPLAPAFEQPEADAAFVAPEPPAIYQPSASETFTAPMTADLSTAVAPDLSQAYAVPTNELATLELPLDDWACTPHGY